MAERMGFEPMKELLLYTLSKRAPSTTRPSLQNNLFFLFVRAIIIKDNNKFYYRVQTNGYHSYNCCI